MFSFNQFIVTGNVTKDAEVKPTKTGKDMARVTIVTQRSRKLEDGTWENTPDFHNIVLFGRLAEHAKKLRKGHKASVIGAIQNNNWEKPTGEKVYGQSLIANQLILLTSKNEAISQAVEPDPVAPVETEEETVPPIEPVVEQKKDVEDVFGGDLDI